MATLSIEPHGASMKRVAAASYVGSAIEYYDFYIYGTARRWCSRRCSSPTWV